MRGSRTVLVADDSDTDDSDALYYVLDPNLPPGQHLFTSSASEFEAAKARCRAAGLGCD